MRTVLVWIATLLAFGALDAVWLWFAGPRLYRDVLGAQMNETIDLVPAIMFYVIYNSALVVLVVNPAIAGQGVLWTLALGALFGFAAYATYDLSNQATLRFWQWRLTVVDIAWGTFATALASLAGRHVGVMLLSR